MCFFAQVFTEKWGRRSKAPQLARDTARNSGATARFSGAWEHGSKHWEERRARLELQAAKGTAQDSLGARNLAAAGQAWQQQVCLGGRGLAAAGAWQLLVRS